MKYLLKLHMTFTDFWEDYCLSDYIEGVNRHRLINIINLDLQKAFDKFPFSNI